MLIACVPRNTSAAPTGPYSVAINQSAGTTTIVREIVILSPMLVHPYANCKAYGRFIKPFTADPITNTVAIGPALRATSEFLVHNCRMSAENSAHTLAEGKMNTAINWVAPLYSRINSCSSPWATRVENRG